MVFFKWVIFYVLVIIQVSTFALCPTSITTTQVGTACNNQSAVIQVTGLNPGDTYTIAYTIDAIAQTSASGLTASSNGTVSFNTRVLSAGNDNGKNLVITSFEQSGSETCTGNPINGNTITLAVTASGATGTSSTLQAICSGVATAYTITVSGAASYTIAVESNGLSQSTGTPSAGSNKTSTELNDDVWSNRTNAAVNVVYTITPKSSAGCDEAPFSITVPVKPVVKIDYVTQNTTACEKNNTVFTLLGLLPGTTSTIGYKINNGTTQSATNIVSGADGRATITVGPMQVNYQAQPLSIVSIDVTSPAGICGAPVNATTTMSVKASPMPKTIAANPTAVCSGNSANIQVPASETMTSYQLINNATNALVGAPVQGTGGVINLPTENVTSATAYRVTAANSDNCVSAMNNTVSVDISSAPSGTNRITSNVCSDVALNVTLSATGAGTYNILTDSHGLIQKLGTVSAGNGKAASELEDDSWTNETANTVSVLYTVVPVGANGCYGASFTVTVPVVPEPKGQNTSTAICSRTALNFSLQTVVDNASGGTGVSSTFAWQAANASGAEGESTTIQTTNSITDLLINTSSDRETVVYTVTPASANNACVGNSFTVSVGVDPEPVGRTETIMMCSNTALNYSIANNMAILGNGVRSAFTWSASVNSNVSGSSTTQQSGAIISDLLTNATSSTQNVSYTITPRSLPANCTGSVFAITVSVRPHPVGQNYAAAICSKDALNVSLQNTISNNVTSTFSWYGSDQSSVTGETTSVSMANVLADVLENSDNQPRVVRYTITPKSSNNCQGNSYFADITVNPSARFSAGSDAQTCPQPGTFSLNGTVSYAPNGVHWSGGAGTFSDPSAPTATYTIAPSEAGSTIRLTLIADDPDGSGPCAQLSSSMQLKINTLPTVGFTGFAKNPMYQGDQPIILTGSQAGGTFTADPPTTTPTSTTGPLSNALINSTINLDQVTFTPSNARVDENTTVTYSFTDSNTGCRKSYYESVLVKPPTSVTFKLGGTAVEELRFCKNQGKVQLIGDPPVKSGTSSFIAITGNTVVFEGGKYYFETTGLAPGTYRVKYIYDASTNSESTGEVIIVDSPVASFIPDKTEICLGEKITFTDNSTPDGSNLAIETREWKFGDPALEDADIEYNADKTTALVPYKNSSGNFAATLKITTRLGCIVTSGNTVIQVGTPSFASFSWTGQCLGNATKFTATSTNATDIYSWDFGDGDVLVLGNVPVPKEKSNNGFTSGTGKSPIHTYSEAKVYEVKLSVETTSGCNSLQISRVLNILNYETIEANGFYFQDFNNSKNQDWVVEAYQSKNSPTKLVADPTYIPSDTSWIRSTPAGVSGLYAVGDRGTVWWTGSRRGKHLKTYAKNENSVVLSPCFNFKNISSCMISFDYCVDTERDYDGAVVQYSLDDGDNWLTVGDNSGANSINWYNTNNIQASPGDQKGFVYGWTGTSLSGISWLTAAFPLTAVSKAERIRFRVAFGSNDKDQDAAGFGFDNVFIGEKQRNILIEHFTNNDPDISKSDATLETLIKDWSHLNNIRYHTQYPMDDKLYKDNPIDPGARALYYEISKPPYSLLDGKAAGGESPVGSAYNLTPGTLQMASLRQPGFSLLVRNDDSVTEDEFVKVFVKLVAETAVDEPVLLQVALVEKAVTADGYTADNVVRKLLFGAEGRTITTKFAKEDEMEAASEKVKLYFPLTGIAGNCVYVAFVQNKRTREVYQSAIIQAPDKKGSPVTGFEEREPSFIFPNPAKDYVLLPTMHQQAAWTLVDQAGRILLKGDLNGSSDYHKVDLTTLTQGIYIVTIHYADKIVSRNKLAIIR